MRADSIHGSIGRRMLRTPEISTFDEFVEICDKSAKLIKPICLQHHEVHTFAELHRTRSTKKVKLPKIGEIKQAKFEKGSKQLAYCVQFGGEEEKVEFLKPTTNLSDPIPTSEAPRGINATKKRGLLKLIHSFPASKRKFWHDLVGKEENKDLVSAQE